MNQITGFHRTTGDILKPRQALTKRINGLRDLLIRNLYGFAFQAEFLVFRQLEFRRHIQGHIERKSLVPFKINILNIDDIDRFQAFGFHGLLVETRQQTLAGFFLQILQIVAFHHLHRGFAFTKTRHRSHVSVHLQQLFVVSRHLVPCRFYT